MQTAFALAFADRYPWITCYTPFNEALVTTLLAGHEGVWYPYGNGPHVFVQMLLNVARAICETAQELKRVNPPPDGRATLRVPIAGLRPGHPGPGRLVCGGSHFRRMAEKYGKTPRQVALNWLVSQDNVVVIARTRAADHLCENLGALDWRLKAADVALLRTQYPGQLERSDVYALR